MCELEPERENRIDRKSRKGFRKKIMRKQNVRRVRWFKSVASHAGKELWTCTG